MLKYLSWQGIAVRDFSGSSMLFLTLSSTNVLRFGIGTNHVNAQKQWIMKSIVVFTCGNVRLRNFSAINPQTETLSCLETFVRALSLMCSFKI